MYLINIYLYFQTQSWLNYRFGLFVKHLDLGDLKNPNTLLVSVNSGGSRLLDFCTYGGGVVTCGSRDWKFSLIMSFRLTFRIGSVTGQYFGFLSNYKFQFLSINSHFILGIVLEKLLKFTNISIRLLLVILMFWLNIIYFWIFYYLHFIIICLKSIRLIIIDHVLLINILN